jgi:hypothetical protein
METKEDSQPGDAVRTPAKESESAGTVMEGVVGPSDLTIEVSPLSQNWRLS